LSRPLVAVVFDHTALLALGAGSRRVSALVSQAHLQAGRYVYAPALCLVAAISQRPGLATHLGVLPAVAIIDLDYVASTTVGALVAGGLDWQLAQAVDAGRPTAEWPAGRPVVTAGPDAYTGLGVEVISLE